MKKTPHIIWVSPNSQLFFRSRGDVKSRPASVLPKLVEQGYKIDVLIPHDPTLLPKSKLAPSRISKHEIKLSQSYKLEIIKLTRGATSPGIYMAKFPLVEAPLNAALLSQAAIQLAKELNKPVDIFHLFGWETALLPIYLELEKKPSKLFQDTKRFITVSSLRNQGNFSPGILDYIGIPKELFHPEGIEFFGKVSFLKAGLLFSDGVGLIDEGPIGKNSNFQRAGTGFEGLLDALSFKLRRWASDRSLKMHHEAYKELLSLKQTKPLLPHLLRKLHSSDDEAQKFIESWGPVPADQYHVNSMSLLMQSPRKAYTFWEWAGNGAHSAYSLVLEDVEFGTRVLLEKNVPPLGDYWVDVVPGRTYCLELMGVNPAGQKELLLRSAPLHVARDSMSPYTNAVFIDVKSRKRTAVRSNEDWLKSRFRSGQGSSAWEWSPSGWAHSVELSKK